jgi:glycosyltransferase involved in cell wall biosynthesis
MDYLHNKDQYLRRYGVLRDRPVFARFSGNIEHAVVIPALQEKQTLFETLASLAGNTATALEKTLVIIVVNNHSTAIAKPEEIKDNQATLAILRGLIQKGDISQYADERLKRYLRIISHSHLRLAFLDASSPGREIPDNWGGVGTARKMGMDAALTLLDERAPGGGVITCLDADTVVEENFLSAIRYFFRGNKHPAAVVRYAHRMPSDTRLFSAICRYEIFLRSYVIGLSFAGSPYAVPSIGSTISCRAESYVAVRGMNRNEAAEDFHFLDKLAKLQPIGFIADTTIHPSARLSKRVPFGTGSRMTDVIEKGRDEFLIYNPEIFVILRKFLSEMDGFPNREATQIMASVFHIDPALHGYLEASRFPRKWEAIRRNHDDPERLRRQFHVWFDGLKTLRLVHHLSRRNFPPLEMFSGLKRLLEMIGKEIFTLKKNSADTTKSEDLLNILEELRVLFPYS